MIAASGSGSNTPGSPKKPKQPSLVLTLKKKGDKGAQAELLKQQDKERKRSGKGASKRHNNGEDLVTSQGEPWLTALPSRRFWSAFPLAALLRSQPRLEPTLRALAHVQVAFDGRQARRASQPTV